jgi:transcriptional regulator with XRE-family HTH domain
MAGHELSGPVDTDFGIPTVREKTPLPSPLGAGYLILVVRELSGLSQRSLARAVGTSQPTHATLETGNRTPTIRTLMRVAQATGFELVIGLRRPGVPPPDPAILHAQGFDLLGTLRPDPQDGLADFVVLREPSPFEGPR